MATLSNSARNSVFTGADLSTDRTASSVLGVAAGQMAQQSQQSFQMVGSAGKLAQLGWELADTASKVVEAKRAERQISAGIEAAGAMPDIQLAVSRTTRNFREANSGAPLDTGTAYLKALDTDVSQVIKAMPSKEAQGLATLEYQKMKNTLAQQHGGWETSENISNTAANVSSASLKFSRLAIEEGSPDKALLAFSDFMKPVSAVLGAKETTIQFEKGSTQIVKSYLDSLLLNKPYEAFKQIESGKYDVFIPPDEKFQMRGKAVTAARNQTDVTQTRFLANICWDHFSTEVQTMLDEGDYVKAAGHFAEKEQNLKDTKVQWLSDPQFAMLSKEDQQEKLAQIDLEMESNASIMTALLNRNDDNVVEDDGLISSLRETIHEATLTKNGKLPRKTKVAQVNKIVHDINKAWSDGLIRKSTRKNLMQNALKHVAKIAARDDGDYSNYPFSRGGYGNGYIVIRNRVDDMPGMTDDEKKAVEGRLQMQYDNAVSSRKKTAYPMDPDSMPEADYLNLAQKTLRGYFAEVNPRVFGNLSESEERFAMDDKGRIFLVTAKGEKQVR